MIPEEGAKMALFLTVTDTELENTVEGAAILTAGPLIDVAELQMSDGSNCAPRFGPRRP